MVPYEQYNMAPRLRPTILICPLQLASCEEAYSAPIGPRHVVLLSLSSPRIAVRAAW